MRSTLSDIPVLTDADLIEDLIGVHTRLTIHKAHFLFALAEFHERKLARQQGAPNTSTWLIRHLGVSYRTAAEYLKVGKTMRRFLTVAQHFLNGEFSYSVVRLLQRYLTDVNQDELVDLALRLTYRELEQALSGRPRVGAGKPGRTNCLSIARDPETGELRFWGRLDSAHGAELLSALKIGELAQLRDITPEDLDDLLKDNGDPTQLTVDLDPAPEEPGDGNGEAAPVDAPVDDAPAPLTRFGPPTATSLFSAFLGMINVVRTTPRSTVRAPGAELNILLGPDGRLVLPGHLGADAANLLRTILNGAARIHLLDRNGIHLKLSRSARTVSPGLEKALLARWDHQCATPACPHTRFLQFHHLTAWVDGGGTDPDNLIPLCSACHAMISAGTLTIHVDQVDPALLHFRLPGGHSFTSVNRGLPERNPRRDHYASGPVPLGDESLIVQHAEDSFDDVA